MNHRLSERNRRSIRRFLCHPTKSQQRILVACFALIGFFAPLLYGCLKGFPATYFHDEFSYLLGADTFANGRLTNPTPAFSEHFEAPHILVKPTYMSKYPPMQSLFLAAGQVLFGHPIFGVWLSCGLAAAALFWMLLAWTRPPWAIIGTLLSIFFIGTDYYWAQGYWGGMAAFAGGAFFFGGFRRIIKEKELLGSTLLMTLGGVILVNSRPFEGTITMIPALLLLLFRILSSSRIAFSQKLTQIVLPGFFITCLTLCAMGYFNYRITGSALRLPYTEHQSQYFSTPLFIFQNKVEATNSENRRLRELYGLLHSSGLIRDIHSYNLPDVKYLYPVYAFVYLWLHLLFALVYPPLLLFFVFSLFFVVRASKWMRFVLFTIVFAFACISFATYWDFTHYVAPLVCFFYLLLVQGFRYFLIRAQKAKKLKLTFLLLILLTLSSAYYRQFKTYEWVFDLVHTIEKQDFSNTELKLTESQTFDIKVTATQYRGLIEETAEKDAQKYLIIVDYDKSFHSFDEIVFNRADFQNAKVIWALSLSEEKNHALLNFYPDRKPLFVKIKRDKFRISPNPGESFPE